MHNVFLQSFLVIAVQKSLKWVKVLTEFSNVDTCLFLLYLGQTVFFSVVLNKYCVH